MICASCLQGDGQVGIKSAFGFARALAGHPDAIWPILRQLTVKPVQPKE